MSNFIVNTDIPNLKVVIREGDAYNINIVPGRINTIRTGSFTSYADMAGLAASASYVSGAGIFANSSSYAITASYAENLADISAFPYSGSGVITGSLLMLDTADQGGITGSLYGTASVADGIDVIFAGTFETGSEGVIIPSPSGGLTYINSASYALTASYLNDNTWENISNKPEGLLSSSVQVYNIPVESAVYSETASYAQSAPLAYTSSNQDALLNIPFISGSTLAIDDEPHFRYNPFLHRILISGSEGLLAMGASGITLTSGSGNTSTLLRYDGLFVEVNNDTIGIVPKPSLYNGHLTGYNNPGIYITSGALFTSAYIPLEFQGSASYTDGRVTANKKFVAKEGIEVTGSLDIQGTGSINGDTIVSSTSITKIETITSASYAALTPVSGTLYIIID